jgi:acetyl esterase
MTDYVRPDVQAFLAYLNNVPGPKMHEMGPVAARQMYVAMRPIADADVGELAVITDLSIPGPEGNTIPARLYDARDKREPGPVMVFFHGGGFVIGDLDSHEPYCAEAARQLDMPVIAIDYRLAPECPFPAAPDDCEAAARWVAGSPAALGRAVTSLVLSGDSAGGNLTIVTTQALRDKPAAVPVIAQFPIYPATDAHEGYASYEQHKHEKLLTEDAMTWFFSSYNAPDGHARAAPLHNNHEGTPPTLVLTAGLDPIRDQGRAYAAALAQAGVTVSYREAEGNIHGFICLRRAVPSSTGDISGAFAVLKPMIAEAEADRVMRQAAKAA